MSFSESSSSQRLFSSFVSILVISRWSCLEKHFFRENVFFETVLWVYVTETCHSLLYTSESEMMSSVKTYLLNLNIFESSSDDHERVDEQQRYWNIIGTRLYFLVLIIILLAVAVVSWLSTEVTAITIRQPSKDEFESLPFDAQCPCSRGSISYDDFTSLEAILHQVCSSDFVSDRWIEATQVE